MGDILFLAHRIPYPPDKGDKIRSWNILKYLAARENVHLGAFVDDPADMVHASALQAICKSVKLLPQTRADRFRRALGGWRRELPLSVAMFEDQAMRSWVWERIKQDNIDRIFVFSGQMAPYALGHTSESRRIVMDFVDVDSEKFAAYATETRWPKSKIYAREAELLGTFEKQVARHVDVSLFVSDAESALFRKLAGSYAHTVETLGNGVDLDYFNARAEIGTAPPSGSPRLVFTGAMDYRPNVDAVLWFAANVFPLVRQDFPNAAFDIVGGKPGATVQTLSGQAGITVTGRVPDVRPYLAAADVVVAPLRIARGIQNKVLEAMAMGRPVVATSAAFSGIEAKAEHDLVIRDDAAGFAAAIADIVRSPELASNLGTNGRRCMELRYAWPAQLAKLDRFLGLHKLKDVAA